MKNRPMNRPVILKTARN